MTDERTVPLISRFAAPCVLAIYLGLAGWVWFPAAPAPAPVKQAAQDSLVRISQGQERLAELVEVTTTQPLFTPSRRPEAQPEATQPAPAPDPTLTLLGVVGGDGNRVALVRLSTSSELHRVKQGDQLGAWQIDEIGIDFVRAGKTGSRSQLLTIGG